MTDGKQQHCEHTLEWIATGLVALFILAAIAFYSFSVDVRSVNAQPDGKSSSHHRL